MKHFLPLSVLLGLGVIANPLNLRAEPSETNSTASIEAIRKKYNLPALALVVLQDSQIRDRVATGVRKFGDPTPVTTNDVWHIGSCTKSMTATLAARMIEEGKLKWTTTIAEVFPEMKGKMNASYETVTMEQLVMHRGGVPAKPPAAPWKRAWEQHETPVEQRREFIAAVLSEPPEAPPGTKMIYSNQGYAIAGAMLETISKVPFERLIAEKLFDPLRMKTAGFGVPGEIGKTAQPWGHTKRLNLTVPVQEDNPPAIAPAGRVHCSLDDLAKFVRLHLTNGKGVDWLKPEDFTRLHTPPDGGDYACGWVVVKRGWAGNGPALMHNGSNTMWYLVMWLAPEKNFAVIAATNFGGPEAAKACDDVAGAMIQKWLPK